MADIEKYTYYIQVIYLFQVSHKFIYPQSYYEFTMNIKFRIQIIFLILLTLINDIKLNKNINLKEKFIISLRLTLTPFFSFVKYKFHISKRMTILFFSTRANI